MSGFDRTFACSLCSICVNFFSIPLPHSELSLRWAVCGAVTNLGAVKGRLLFCFMMEEKAELAKKKQDEKENNKPNSVVLFLGLCLGRVVNVDV